MDTPGAKCGGGIPTLSLIHTGNVTKLMLEFSSRLAVDISQGTPLGGTGDQVKILSYLPGAAVHQAGTRHHTTGRQMIYIFSPLKKINKFNTQ